MSKDITLLSKTSAIYIELDRARLEKEIYMLPPFLIIKRNKKTHEWLASKMYCYVEKYVYLNGSIYENDCTVHKQETFL